MRYNLRILEKNTQIGKHPSFWLMAACSSCGLVISSFILFATSASAAVSETVTVGITITAASSSSSSSSSSTSSSSSSTSGEEGPSGQKRKTTENIIKRITGIDIEYIIKNRRLPANVLNPNPLHQAAQTPCLDIPSGVWYEDALAEFMAQGYLESCQEFSGLKLSTRGDLARFLVLISGHELVLTESSSFTDTPLGSEYFEYIETAAHYGWLKGDDNCYGRTNCTARPDDHLTRAEAAAMMIRFWQLEPTHKAPLFYDVPNYAWYKQTVQTAADYCILQGDGGTNNASAERNINQAEIITMLHRAILNLAFGKDCYWQSDQPAAAATYNQFTASIIPTNNIAFTGVGIITPKKLLSILILSIAGILMGLVRLYILEQKE